MKIPRIPANTQHAVAAEPGARGKNKTPPDLIVHEIPHAMRRIRVIVAYDGTDFHGWQVQPDLRTVQGTLEEAVRAIEGEPVIVHGSGRTDAGVHADAQVAAFSLTNPIPVNNLRRAINRLLPPTIRILEASEAATDFHPRFDAVAKTYEYRLFRAEVCPPPLWRYVHHHPFPLDTARMIPTARIFEGQHDFSAFAAADDRDAAGRSKVRTVFSSQVEMDDALLRFRIRGSGFLKHMVRNLTACLIESGKGNIDDDQVRALLQPGCGERFPHSAPAKGLHLISVEYGTLIR